MRHTDPIFETTVRAICYHLVTDVRGTDHEQRTAAASILIRRLTGIQPETVPVRAACYARRAWNQLGCVIVPKDLAQVQHFREQVGPAMVLLGMSKPHVVLFAGTLMIELADGLDWQDRGVLLRSFVAKRPDDDSAWTVSDLRYGVQVGYERLQGSPTIPTAILGAHRLAREVEELMRRCGEVRFAI